MSGNGKVFFSPLLFPEGGQWIFYLPCHCSGLLLVLKQAGRVGISLCAPFFLPLNLPVTVKLPKRRDLRPGSGDSSAFYTTPTASPLCSQYSVVLVGVMGSPSLPDKSILCSFFLAFNLASPFPFYLRFIYISILKHYATLYVCVAGKKLSDTHWCY